MGLVDFVEALEVVLVRLGEGNNQQGCSDDHLGTGILELAARYLGCNKSKGSPHIGFWENLETWDSVPTKGGGAGEGFQSQVSINFS